MIVHAKIMISVIRDKSGTFMEFVIFYHSDTLKFNGMYLRNWCAPPKSGRMVTLFNNSVVPLIVFR